MNEYTQAPAKDIQRVWQRTPIADTFMFSVENAIQVLETLGYTVEKDDK